MYTIVYAKVGINKDTNGEVMSNVGVKHGCLLPPTLFSLYIDGLKTYLDETDIDSPCLINVVVAILLYVDRISFAF